MSQTPVLSGLRRRGQFLVAAVLWAATAGFVVMAAGYALVLYHYGLSLAERLRLSLGFHAPAAGPDWYLLVVLALPPIAALGVVALAWSWYRKIWRRRLVETWGDREALVRHSHLAASRAERQEYLAALAATPAWQDIPKSDPPERTAESILREIEQDIVERAFATGMVVGISGNRGFDLFTIFAAAMELQLHVLTRLGKRPSSSTWRLLLERCGASLFVNSYLSRQDALLLNLAVKKMGLGLHAAGDAMDAAVQHLTSHDVDLDDLLHLNKLEGVPLSGLATKGLEVAATMTLTVGKQGLHAIGNLVEAVGDELAQGALAAAILYHHGMALAADTLALDAQHRQAEAMNRGFGEGLQRMAAMAGSILLDCVRQRRAAFREVRQAAVKQLPKMAAGGLREKIGSLFGQS